MVDRFASRNSLPAWPRPVGAGSGTARALAPKSCQSSFSRRLDCRDLFADETELPADLFLDHLERRGIVFQELLDVFAPLTKPLAAERKPRPALLDDPPIDGHIQQVALARDAFAIHHVELRFAEWRRDLVLDHLHACWPADDGG